MTRANDLFLSALAVRLRYSDTEDNAGSGVICYQPHLKDHVYIITAAHCLYEDQDKLEKPLTEILIDVLKADKSGYVPILNKIDHRLVSKDEDLDVAVLRLTKEQVEAISGTLPQINAVMERGDLIDFVLKGFPLATQGKELDVLTPVWHQQMTVVNKFQLEITQDYRAGNVAGFSGSGIFLIAGDEIYLYGIFTRYRDDKKGRIIYAQYLDTVNNLLRQAYLPSVRFTFLGENGLTPTFFAGHISDGIKALDRRFNSELNIRMPVAKLLRDMAKDNYFRNRLTRRVNTWLILDDYRPYDRSHHIMIKASARQQSAQDVIKALFENAEWSGAVIFNPENITQVLEDLNQSLVMDQDVLYQEQASALVLMRQDESKQGKGYPLAKEIERIRTMIYHNQDLLKSLKEVHFALVNDPVLLIEGPAGCGKSHLLGDAATQRLRNGQLSLLLLGQQFKAGATPWQTILSRLGLSITKTQLLKSLDNIGRQTGSRVLILIDALNEGDGIDVWPDELIAFINEIKRYPCVGLVMTIRDTYMDIIIPEGIMTGNQVNHYFYEGFTGNDYEILGKFCEAYGLRHPEFPILNQEFSNPLFLHLLCAGVADSPSKTFPKGFQGFRELYAFYMSGIDKKLKSRRSLVYRRALDIAVGGAELFADAAFTTSSKILPLNDVQALFSKTYPQFPDLLEDLLAEGLMMQVLSRNEQGKPVNSVQFTYQRLGDLNIAEQLIKPFSSLADLIQAFDETGPLGKIFTESRYANYGLLEIFSILLPEKYGLELHEVISWKFSKDGEITNGIFLEDLNRMESKSLWWRKPQSVDRKKLIQHFKSPFYLLEDKETLNYFFNLATIEGHPLNSDCLTELLVNMPLAKRDAFLQHCFLQQRLYGTGDFAFPFERIIDWAWTKDISGKVNEENARLTAQALAWLLCSTDISLRDRATKAMVNLLEEQPAALIKLLNNFKNIDDPYISERLYAAAYGCALRAKSSEHSRLLAQFVFDLIFSSGNPPLHVLLRDYARGVVACALHKGVQIKGDVKKIHPPYGSDMPRLPELSAVKTKYYLDYSDPDYKTKNGYYNNQIFDSVTKGDFHIYVLRHALNGFSPASFKVDEEFKSFLAGLMASARNAVELLTSHYHLLLLQQRESQVPNSMTGTALKSMQKSTKNMVALAKSMLKHHLSKKQRDFLLKIVLPNMELTVLSEDNNRYMLNQETLEAWMINRVFELGYDSTVHGEYDGSGGRFNSRHKNLVERIGKKYQWIALHELVAAIADNFPLGHGYGKQRKYHILKGPWQLSLRDIDPAFITKNQTEPDEEEEDVMETDPVSEWWMADAYEFWAGEARSWSENADDLPALEHIIERTDDEEQKWIYLNVDVSWIQATALGQKKYTGPGRDIHYVIRGFVLEQKNVGVTRSDLGKNVATNMSLTMERNWSQLLNREHYRAAASVEQQSEHEDWFQLDGSKRKVMYPLTSGVSELSADQSGAHYIYQMPVKDIFEAMKLSYAAVEGDFLNPEGECVVTNVNPRGALIKKSALLAYLAANELTIAWAVIIEKTNSENSQSDFHRNTFRGIYYLDSNGKISGSLKIEK